MGYFAGTKADERPYQQRIVQTVVSMLEGTHKNRHDQPLEPVKSILIEAPCGSGKTVMGLAIAQHMERAHGARVGWSAMRRNLLKQVKVMHDALGFDIKSLQTISMFDRDPPVDVDFLVVDEAQHDNCNSMANIHSMIRPKWVIGLTATPYRTDGSQLSFEQTVRDIGINTCIQEGWLSRYDHFTIRKFTPQIIAELFRTTADKWGKSVVFFFTMAECQELAQRLTGLGVTNELVWGDSDRQAQLAAFDTGQIQVLISMSILCEGFDAVDMKTVFVRPSSKLPTVQMGGRVLRRCDMVPIKQIVQCQDTKFPFVRIARPRETYVDVAGQFASLQQNENIQALSDQMIPRVLEAQVYMPPFVKINRTKKQIIADKSGRRWRSSQ